MSFPPVDPNLLNLLSSLSALNIKPAALAPAKTPGLQEVYEFYSGTGKESTGKTLKDIWGMSVEEKWKNFMYFMPWLFPLDTPSQNNNYIVAPVVQKDVFCVLLDDIIIKRNVKTSFKNVLEMMGLQYDEKVITEAHNYGALNPKWLFADSKFYLSISRMLTSLVMFNLDVEAKALKIWLDDLLGDHRIPGESFIYWGESVKMKKPPAIPASAPAALLAPMPMPVLVLPCNFKNFIAFYTGKGKDAEGRTLQDIHDLLDKKKNDKNRFNWLFPLNEDSKLNDNKFSSQLTTSDFLNIQVQQPELIKNVKLSFTKVLTFLGFEYDEAKKEVLLKTSPSVEQLKTVPRPAIMISSLLHFGLLDEARALNTFFEKYYTNVKNVS